MLPVSPDNVLYILPVSPDNVLYLLPVSPDNVLFLLITDSPIHIIVYVVYRLVSLVDY